MTKGQRRTNGSFELSESPSHLLRRCSQFFGDLYAYEASTSELTKQQFTLLAALEHNDGVSQTALVEVTGIDRSTLADMVRRMLERGLLSRERAEEDQRTNALVITPAGRKGLRSARTALERAEEKISRCSSPGGAPALRPPAVAACGGRRELRHQRARSRAAQGPPQAGLSPSDHTRMSIWPPSGEAWP